MRDGFTFYRSFYDGVKDLDDKTYRRLLNALICYALDGVEPNLSGLENAVFQSWKANVKASNKRRDDGAKGGRPTRHTGNDENNHTFDIENHTFDIENHTFDIENHTFDSENHAFDSKKGGFDNEKGGFDKENHDFDNEKGGFDSENLTRVQNKKEKENIKEKQKENAKEKHTPPTPSKWERVREANDLFESLWELYPRKKGKGSVSDTQKLKLLKIGLDELTRCIDRYKHDSAGKDEQYIMYGSTFFNSGYVDYLDENYADNTTDIDKDVPFYSDPDEPELEEHEMTDEEWIAHMKEFEEQDKAQAKEFGMTMEEYYAMINGMAEKRGLSSQAFDAMLETKADEMGITSHEYLALLYEKEQKGRDSPHGLEGGES